MDSFFVGIEIGGTKIQVVTGDNRAQILDRHRYNADSALGAEGIRNQIAEALSEIQAAKKIRSIGVGFGGPFNRESGRTCCSHQVIGWDDFPLRQWLRDQAGGVPVNIDNDANVAALGEARYGAGVGENPVFYVTLGSGIGGGLVIDGKMFHGALPTYVPSGALISDLTKTAHHHECGRSSREQRKPLNAALLPAS